MMWCSTERGALLCGESVGFALRPMTVAFDDLHPPRASIDSCLKALDACGGRPMKDRDVSTVNVGMLNAELTRRQFIARTGSAALGLGLAGSLLSCATNSSGGSTGKGEVVVITWGDPAHAKRL